jgi:nucleoside-diphosphate-sugar epimerase
MQETMANIEKAKRLFGWKPNVNTFEGLKSIIKKKDLLQFIV